LDHHAVKATPVHGSFQNSIIRCHADNVKVWRRLRHQPFAARDFDFHQDVKCGNDVRRQLAEDEGRNGPPMLSGCLANSARPEGAGVWLCVTVWAVGMVKELTLESGGFVPSGDMSLFHQAQRA